MADELRPCPFCGAEAEIVRNGSGSYFVRCADKQCAAKTRLYHENENGARLAWNRREVRTCRIVSAKEAGRPGYAPACSVCGWQSVVWDQYSYCPSCGARVEP